MITEKHTLPVNAEEVSSNAEDTCTTIVVDIESTTEQTNSNELVDFSDEDAQLAANAPDFHLGEETADEKEVFDSQESSIESSGEISQLDKEALLALFSKLLETQAVQGVRKDVEAIKIAYYKIHRAAVEAAKKTFVDAGGNPEEFESNIDDSEKRFKELFRQYRAKRDEFINNSELQKEENLKRKLLIIERLKELISSEETLNHTFTQFRDLQLQWKGIGLVPQLQLKDLRETYNLYIEQFYDFIKINKELRDLDFKKNYVVKLALCEETEALINDPSIINAFHKLQKLHEQWKEIGPVTMEQKDLLWGRFKDASSCINKLHQDHFEKMKDEQKQNLDNKIELCQKAQELVATAFSTRKEWGGATEVLLEIQKIWKTIGFAPKKDNTKIYEEFRTVCDRFFEVKRKFYLENKGEMEHNMELKQEICLKAESLVESTQWKKTSEELIVLQKEWKAVGSVSRRHSEIIWKRFRTACDSFFDRKNKHFSTVDEQYVDNLNNKKALLVEIEACVLTNINFNTIKEYQRRWSEIGFVPMKEKDKIQTAYKAIMDKLFAAMRSGEKDRKVDRFKSKMGEIRGGKKMHYERDRLYGKVRQLEADIALLENNIGFFSKSKNAEAMINAVNSKIAKAKQEMQATIKMVNMIDEQNLEKE